jgi:hypothetical protein
MVASAGKVVMFLDVCFSVGLVAQVDRATAS